MNKVKIAFLVLALASSAFFLRGISLSPRNSFLSPDPKQEQSADFKNEDDSPKASWFTKETLIKNPPEVSAKSAIAIDLTAGKIIFEKDPHRPLPIASTVKILTALVALEHKALDETITASFQAERVGESSMGLSIGEKLKLEELLYGLLLPSGNDAAEAIAEGIAQRREIFVAWMNNKAKSLGLKNSHFTNPSGLDDSRNDQYSSAYDLAVITKEALDRFPILRKIVATREKAIKRTATHKAYYLKNRLSLSQSNPQIKGVKPGFTDEAGLCLVSLAQDNGREILAVFLNSENPGGDAQKIFQFGFTLQKP